MKIPYLIKIMFIIIFSMNCGVDLQFMVGDNSKPAEKNDDTSTLVLSSDENNNLDKNSEENDYVISEMTFEIKKLRAELNNAVSEINNLKKTTTDLENPFNTYNKEILLNNGSTIQGKILYQDDQTIKVATLIGTLTVDRNTIIRIVEKSPLATATIEEAVSQSKSSDLSGSFSDGFIGAFGDQPQGGDPIMNSANLVLVGNIDEKKDNSGNTIITGNVKNIGTQRADFSKVTFTIKKNWNGDIKMMTSFVQGTYHTFESGITANSSILPGASASFELIIPASLGPFIGYSYEIEWEEYQ